MHFIVFFQTINITSNTNFVSFTSFSIIVPFFITIYVFFYIFPAFYVGYNLVKYTNINFEVKLHLHRKETSEPPCVTFWVTRKDKTIHHEHREICTLCVQDTSFILLFYFSSKTKQKSYSMSLLWFEIRFLREVESIIVYIWKIKYLVKEVDFLSHLNTSSWNPNVT